MTNKPYLKLISAAGILFILAGSIYFTVDIANKKSKLDGLKHISDSLDARIDSTTTSLVALEKKKAELQNIIAQQTTTINELTATVENTHNKKAIAESNKIIAINQTVVNTLKSAGIEKEGTAQGPIVYIQVNSDSTQQRLKEMDLIGQLRQRNYRADGYETVKGKANNTLKYFHPEDESAANELRNALVDIDKRLDLKPMYVKGFEEKVPAKQMELWIK